MPTPATSFPSQRQRPVAAWFKHPQAVSRNHGRTAPAHPRVHCVNTSCSIHRKRSTYAPHTATISTVAYSAHPLVLGRRHSHDPMACLFVHHRVSQRSLFWGNNHDLTSKIIDLTSSERKAGTREREAKKWRREKRWWQSHLLSSIPCTAAFFERTSWSAIMATSTFVAVGFSEAKVRQSARSVPMSCL